MNEDFNATVSPSTRHRRVFNNEKQREGGILFPAPALHILIGKRIYPERIIHNLNSTKCMSLIYLDYLYKINISKSDYINFLYGYTKLNT